MGALMDISGAFNHTSRDVIVRAMNRYQTPLLITEWIHHKMEHHLFEVNKGNTTTRRTVDSICP